MNSYPNSDCKQCTESKLGWVHNAHTLSPGRKHTARAVPRSWALLRAQRPCRAHSQRRPRAQRAQIALIAPKSWAHVATSLPCPVNRPGRNVTSMSRPPGGHPMSRHHIGVATPSLLPSIKPGRDFISRSRPLGRPTYVATSTPCRDILKTNLCRDIVFMSRPPRLMSMSRHQIHVATSSPA